MKTLGLVMAIAWAETVCKLRGNPLSKPMDPYPLGSYGGSYFEGHRQRSRRRPFCDVLLENIGLSSIMAVLLLDELLPNFNLGIHSHELRSLSGGSQRTYPMV